MRQSSIFISLGILTWIAFGTTSLLEAAHEVPFRLHRGHLILVQGNIGHLDDLTFLIDTGASSTFLSKQVAKKLQLEGIQTKAVAYSGEIRAKSTLIPQLEVGSKRFYSVPAMITDTLPRVSEHLDAIIGMNVLARENFRIDYESRILTFGELEQLPFSTRLGKKHLAPIIELRSEGKSLRLLLDTGAGDLILFRQQVNGLSKLKKTLFKKKIHHLGSEEEMRLVVLPEVASGEMEWEDQKAYLLDSAANAYSDLDGIAGITALGLDAFQLDFQKGQISWTR